MLPRCGALCYAIADAPLSGALCFCRECQHVSGGGPAVIAVFAEEGFRYTAAEPASFARPDLEQPVVREFCGACGTPLLSRSPRAPGKVLVKAGTLDDPSIVGTPSTAIYVAEAQAFHAVPEGVRQFQGRPGG